MRWGLRWSEVRRGEARRNKYEMRWSVMWVWVLGEVRWDVWVEVVWCEVWGEVRWNEVRSEVCGQVWGLVKCGWRMWLERWGKVRLRGELRQSMKWGEVNVVSLEMWVEVRGDEVRYEMMLVMRGIEDFRWCDVRLWGELRRGFRWEVLGESYKRCGVSRSMSVGGDVK